MKFFPELEEVKKIAADGKYRVLPVSCEMLSDFTTPIETMKILKNVSTHCYMLESAMANDKWGRYTFMGYEPKMEITCRDGEMKAGSFSVKTEDPSKFLRQILAEVTFDTESLLFKGCPKKAPVARYHSLAADPETMPDVLKVTAVTDDGEIMAVQHVEYPIYGVQFHPESIMTPDGKAMIQNFLEH